MNAKKMIAAVAVFAATGSVFAGEITPWPELENFRSAKSRAEVIAELHQAGAAGTYVAGGTELPELTATLAKTGRGASAASAPVASQGKSRAQVNRELVDAQRGGNFVVGGTEFSDPVFQRSSATRFAGQGSVTSGTSAD